MKKYEDYIQRLSNLKNLVMWHMVENLNSKNETLATKENKIFKKKCSSGHGLNNLKLYVGD